jgi:hypothetical protein
MSSAADRAREKAARLGMGSVPRPAATTNRGERPPLPPPPYSQPPAVVAPSRAARSKPVRMTLDLAPALHAEFDDWTTGTFRELGLGRINRADVLRALVRQLLDDPETQQRVKEALRQDTRR